MEGLSKKIYLELSAPTEEDSRSDQQRILEALSAEGIEEQVHMPVHILRMIYPLVENAKWKITVSLGWNGENWEILDIEASLWTGGRSWKHYRGGKTSGLCFRQGGEGSQLL